MALKTRPFDAAEYIKSEEDVIHYLEEAFALGNPALIAEALGDVARSRGMTKIAKEAGVSREGLYRALSQAGNPELSTLLKVLAALGLRLSAVRAQTSQDQQEHCPA